jgi:hypothetical protein
MPDLDAEDDNIVENTDSEDEDIEAASPCKKILCREESQALSIPSIDDPCTPVKSQDLHSSNVSSSLF